MTGKLSVRTCLRLCSALAVFSSAANPSTFDRQQPAINSLVGDGAFGLSCSDWSSIRTSYEANRHAVRAMDDGGFQARNPGQRWLCRFDGRGLLTIPEGEGWSWGLDLISYGWDEERLVSTPTRVRVDGQRIVYEWDDTMTEWYVNEQRGLEHGYTLRQRPGVDQSRELQLAIAVRGGLCPQVQSNGVDVRFTDAEGLTVLTYSELAIRDAAGRRLPGRFEATEDGLLLRVNDAEASYPITIDPIAQQAYVKASNTSVADWFGYSISISGDTVVIGAPREDSGAAGVNGDQSNDDLHNAGAAYVFVRSGAAWSQQAYLKASNPGAVDFFGLSVAISGDVIIVGAPEEDSSATGVDGNQDNNSAEGSGAAYVFVRTGSLWSQQAYLKASNADAFDGFGWTVTVSGDLVAVGARLEDSGATGVNGNQNDESAGLSGAVYVFARSGTSWSQEAYLKASNAGAGDFFGLSVALSDTTLVVGAVGEASNTTGVNGDQGNNSASTAGAAYVFVRDGTTWSQQAYLKASNTGTGDQFGWAVSVSADTAVVGAWREDSSATSENGDQGDNSAENAGAAYVFVRNGSAWGQQSYLKASNAGSGDNFGNSVSLSGDVVVVGAHSEDSSAMGIDGNQSDESASGAGAGYVFVRDGTLWTQQAYLKGGSTDAGDDFGWSVAVADEFVLVGVPGEDSAAVGVNGSAEDDGAPGAGAAWVFDLGPVTSPDLNGDGIVNGADLGVLLGQWGLCNACSADLNDDDMVDGSDLGVLLGAWIG